MPTLRAKVHGLVQGVNFRMTARMQARRLALNGWVRNLPDGCVETLAVGPRQALEKYLVWLHGGPPGARVTKVDSRWLDDDSMESAFDSFEIRYGSE